MAAILFLLKVKFSASDISNTNQQISLKFCMPTKIEIIFCPIKNFTKFTGQAAILDFDLYQKKVSISKTSKQIMIKLHLQIDQYQGYLSIYKDQVISFHLFQFQGNMTRHGWASFLERERQIYLSRSRSITLPPISLLFLVLAFSHPLLSLALVLTCSHPFLSLAFVYMEYRRITLILSW